MEDIKFQCIVLRKGTEGFVFELYLSKHPSLHKGKRIFINDLRFVMPFCVINRDMQGVVPNRMEEDKANMTSDSSATANSKTELDNSFFQVTFDNSRCKINCSLSPIMVYELN